MPAIATGLIGFGLGGSTFHAPLIQAEPGLRPQAVASRHPGRDAGVTDQSRAHRMIRIAPPQAEQVSIG